MRSCTFLGPLLNTDTRRSPITLDRPTLVETPVDVSVHCAHDEVLEETLSLVPTYNDSNPFRALW